MTQNKSHTIRLMIFLTENSEHVSFKSPILTEDTLPEKTTPRGNQDNPNLFKSLIYLHWGLLNIIMIIRHIQTGIL